MCVTYRIAHHNGEKVVRTAERRHVCARALLERAYQIWNRRTSLRGGATVHVRYAKVRRCKNCAYVTWR